jgi:predicted CXXCH cytochrome family protein
MQPATADTVLGAFDGREHTSFGVTTRFFERHGRFHVRTEGADGRPADFEILYTFGVEPLQQYLIGFPGGRLQSLTIAWDTRPRSAGGQRWFHLYPEERITPGDPLHWTGRYQVWNAMCAECHSTGLRKGYDVTTDTYRTTWAAIDVGCEACHGPGAAHVAWAARDGQGPASDAAAAAARGPADGKSGLLVRLGGGADEVTVCAPCHSRRTPIVEDGGYGEPLLDHVIPSTLREELYHPDGQILEEVYELGSFAQSKMFAAGVRCSHCHDPHRLGLRARGNALCGQCHGPAPAAGFPTLAANEYDSPAHHFHPAGSAGAQCVSCHMPARTYMVVDERRDHRFGIPRPDLSSTLEVPNACTTCHADRTPQWAAEAAARWWGTKTASDRGTAIAAGRAGTVAGRAGVIDIVRDRGQPAIWRATALDVLGRHPLLRPEVAETLVTATRDPDALVRMHALGALDQMPGARKLALVPPLLEDPVRAVRMEAARVMASVPSTEVPAAQRRALTAALAEFERGQMVQGDLPFAHLNLGAVAAAAGRPGDAERAYLTALRMDSGFLPARFNLANLYNELGRNAEAESTLRTGIEGAPDDGDLHYSLGLVLAEEKRLGEAAEALGRAAALLPGRARVRYNHALALQHLGRRPEAEAELLAAAELDRADPEILYALVVLYAQGGDFDRALPHAQRLVALAPGAPGPRELLERIEAATATAETPD